MLRELKAEEKRVFTLGETLQKRIEDGKYRSNYFGAELALQEIAQATASLIKAQELLRDKEALGMQTPKKAAEATGVVIDIDLSEPHREMGEEARAYFAMSAGRDEAAFIHDHEKLTPSASLMSRSRSGVARHHISLSVKESGQDGVRADRGE